MVTALFHPLKVVGILGDDTDPMVSVMKVDKAPTESYADIGGLESQIQEIKEAVELPLAHPELYEEVSFHFRKKYHMLLWAPNYHFSTEVCSPSRIFAVPIALFLKFKLLVSFYGRMLICGALMLIYRMGAHLLSFQLGIRPPKGVILFGEPGTGKTLLAKAVANQTSATFLRVVGSELIQKYLGDGPKLVRELFRVADDHSPTIVFIDEIDAVGSKRYDSQSGGTKEIQRTMLELLNQLDGFDERGDVKVIMATNKIESLDPALIRPGRIDRKIEFPLPDVKTKRHIFGIHTSRMTLNDDVDLEVRVSSRVGM